MNEALRPIDLMASSLEKLPTLQQKLPQPVPFYVYPSFPSVRELLACPEVRRLDPWGEPMSQFLAEAHAVLGLEHHPWRVHRPEQATLFYVPLLAKLSLNAKACVVGGRKQGHRDRMYEAARALSESSWYRRHNGSDHFFVCTALDMRPLFGKRLWRTVASSRMMHGVHFVPRGAASPAKCQLLVPYLVHTTIAARAAAASPHEALPGPRRYLAQFRGRGAHRVRSVLARRYGHDPRYSITISEYWTSLGCNVRKCHRGLVVDRRTRWRVNETNFDWAAQADEMAASTFCVVPPSESPESSRLYLAVAAGCLPVFISDEFVGAFPHAVPWSSFSLRVPEADLLRKSFNLTALLLAVADDAPRLGAMQWALRTHAIDVLWHMPGSRVATHLLGLAARARGGRPCGRLERGGGEAVGDAEGTATSQIAARAAARTHGVWWQQP